MSSVLFFSLAKSVKGNKGKRITRTNKNAKEESARHKPRSACYKLIDVATEAVLCSELII